jgi:hypothetical protein
MQTMEPPMQITAREAKPATQDSSVHGLYMLLFIAVFFVFTTFLVILALVQFLWLLFVREPNHILVQFGNSLSIWFSEVTRFLSCVSEDRPFPWGSWPDTDLSEPKSPPRQSL